MPDFEQIILEVAFEKTKIRADSLDVFMKKVHVPGVSFVAFVDGVADMTKVYGVTSAEIREPVQPDTLFQAASISKPVAALTCLRLVETGVLDLDADVNDYLKSWKVPEKKITLRQLLSHTAATTVSGFMGYRYDQSIPTIQHILQGVEPANNIPVVVEGTPGEKHNYSGGGTTIAQLVMGEVTGKGLNTLAREWVFELLGMTNSGYWQPLPDEQAKNAARGHFYTADPVPGGGYIMPELAAAGLWTTPTDLYKFISALQAASCGKPSPISQQVAQWMLTPVIELGEGTIQTGLGIFIDGKDTEQYFGYGGSNVGFRCNMRGYLDGRGGLNAMTNSDSGDGLISILIEATDRYYGWKK